MSITISGGFTMTGGGFTLVAAPPPAGPSGWFGGGYRVSPTSNISTVQRINYATDTAIASIRGPLSLARRGLAATGTTTYGWFAGGSTTGPAAGSVSTIDRIDYSSDTSTASVRGPLSSTAYYYPLAFAATGDTTYGWFGGGYAASSIVNRITYATDTATATKRGPLALGRGYSGATGNTTDGWFGAGDVGGFNTSSVNRITYATDTATASVKGPLSLARRGLAATGTTTYGWYAGGSVGAPFYNGVSLVDRITYATDTATASVRGTLTSARQNFAGVTDSTTYGWFGGGYAYGIGHVSIVNRITYATDTATADVRGPMALVTGMSSGSSGIAS
jgi:hypothetical protein